MPGGHVLDPRLDVAQGEDKVTVVGQAAQNSRRAVLRIHVVLQAG
jgi:hypothetical protein